MLSASLSPVRKAPQSTDTAEGLLTSCAITAAGANTGEYACVDTTLDSWEVQGSLATRSKLPKLRYINLLYRVRRLKALYCQAESCLRICTGFSVMCRLRYWPYDEC